jgi:putative peptide zinc metalloprotease protein
MTQGTPNSHTDIAPEQANVQRQEAQSATVADVPQCPALAPHVELVGEMQGTGFTDRQWLIQRDGRFIQVTELLYRVAEQANGERTLDEIAAAVTDSTDWIVTDDNVRQLIQSKLIPMRIIAATGTPGVSDIDDHQGSLVGLSMRKRMLGPSVIDPITKVLQVLYAPPILIPVLVLIAIAHWWLYFVHGIVGSILDVFATPGLLLIVVAIIAVSGVVHEFGHASALRYGGGKVRGMGMGLYIIYPAFYTDTTDSYRLGRWARVRTDLGGFYFHLIFALGIMALYVATGSEYLLLVVLLINLDILYQLLPFVRFDGYWALADITGIPDFFSQMGPFLRSIVSVPGSTGSKLPQLKPWAKAVFVAYIVLTIPVLALLTFLMIRRLPTIVTVILGTLQMQVRSFTDALSAGNVLGMLASVAQIIILGLPLVGIAYMLYRLTWRPTKALWRWSRPTLQRRVAGSLIAVSIIALLVFLWAPQLSFASRNVPIDVQSFGVTEREHVDIPVVYPHIPPVGGNHAPIWQNCGFYDTPVANETGVHSMEHGAVWITYRPNLPQEQVAFLRQLADQQTYVLVSPYPDLPVPIVASAWGQQLQLDSVNDARLEQFVHAFRLGPQAPERGGPCTRGVGTPN